MPHPPIGAHFLNHMAGCNQEMRELRLARERKDPNFQKIQEIVEWFEKFFAGQAGRITKETLTEYRARARLCAMPEGNGKRERFYFLTSEGLVVSGADWSMLFATTLHAFARDVVESGVEFSTIMHHLTRSIENLVNWMPVPCDPEPSLPLALIVSPQAKANTAEHGTAS